MSVPITTIVTNRIRRGQTFTPLPSALREGQSRMDYVELFAALAKPRVLSNEAPVIVAPTPFDPDRPANLIPILQVSLPIPMPIGLTLGAYKPTISETAQNRFREAARFSAIVDVPEGEDPRPQGRYVVEWGVGEARNYVFCDLAPGALQIPVAQSLSVFAHLYSDLPGILEPGDLGAWAGASAYPGDVVEGPDATFSHIIRIFSGGGSLAEFHVVPPFSRSLSAAVFGDNPGAANLVVAASDAFGSAAGTWVLPAPDATGAFATQPLTQPQPLTDEPLPGGADRITLGIFGLTDAGGGYTVERIRL